MARRIIVNWQNGESQRRSITPVAELLVGEPGEKPMYEFRYLAGARDASRLGFAPLPAFPELGRRYTSRELFQFFQNRVLPTTRPDYAEYVQALGLDARTASYAELLGRSNGKRATDRIETVLVPEQSPEGRYTTHFLARGVRHVPGAQEAAVRLEPEQELTMVLDAANAINPRARRLVAETGEIGFVPDYLVADIDALEAAGSRPVVIVERVNPPPLPSHHRVLCRIEAAWPEGFVPFRDPRLVPYEDDARPAAHA